VVEVYAVIKGSYYGRCVWDFNQLDKLLDRFDHETLNELEEFQNIPPTAENIALVLKEKLDTNSEFESLVFNVRVYESPTSYVEV